MSGPTKVLYISQGVDLGGGEKGLFYFIERLNKERFEPLLLCPKSGPLARELQKIGVRSVISPFGVAKKILGFSPLISIFTVIRFFIIIKREKVGIIHSNCVSGLVFSVIPAKLLKIPLVWSVHGWSSGAGLQGVLINFLVSRVIAVSSAVKNFIGKPGKICPRKLVTLSLGVDLEKFRYLAKTGNIRQEFGINNDALVIGMVARLQEIKGHYYFLLAARQIKKEFPQARFMIVGAKLFSDSPEEGYPQDVKKWIKDFGLENETYRTGFRNDIPDILSALDILVLPSLRESFGLSLVEAMACGVPVVATRCQGPEDIIVDGVCGLLVPVKDATAISNAVSFLLRDKEKREAMALSARKRVEELFNLGLLTRKLESIYDEITREKR
jgi:glycosyltransferase involved in cell wall biosynthesis